MNKILFYINILGFGGAERVICNLANQFSEHGYNCIVITSYKTEQEYQLNPNVNRCNLMNNDEKCNKIKKNYILIKRLRKIISEEKPQIMLSFMAEPNIRLLFASVGKKGKKFVSIRNSPDKEYSGFLLPIARVLFGFFDGIIFQTEDAKKMFPQKVQKKSRIIYNQVDYKFYNVISTNERQGIVTVGRLVEQKNHNMLIEAFAQIKDKITDNLYIYGEGPLKVHLEKKIHEMNLEDRVFLMGTYSSIEKELVKYKLFVLSSDFEGMPNSLMEAMATGTPCVSTDCKGGGPRELLKNRKYLCETRDVKGLAMKMLYFLKNPDELQKNACWVKENAINFVPDSVFDEWEKYLCN